MKKVPVYFYYVTVFAASMSGRDIFRFSEFLHSFTKMLESLQGKELIERKKDYFSDQKVVWLDELCVLGNGNYNLTFKSAKYNHVRNVIDTQIMEERGAIKRSVDGDEEKTHLCLRYNGRDNRMICIQESNYYGIGITKIVSYLNHSLASYREETDEDMKYSLVKEDMPGDDFLMELQRMKSISLLKVTVDRADMQDDFLRLANRDNIKDTIDITIGKVARFKFIPKNLVAEYYRDHRSANIIKRIVAEGKNQSGPFRLDTEAIKMKQFLEVDTTELTDEVNSESFFSKSQEKIEDLRSRQNEIRNKKDRSSHAGFRLSKNEATPV